MCFGRATIRKQFGYVLPTKKGRDRIVWHLVAVYGIWDDGMWDVGLDYYKPVKTQSTSYVFLIFSASCLREGGDMLYRIDWWKGALLRYAENTARKGMSNVYRVGADPSLNFFLSFRSLPSTALMPTEDI